MLTLKTLYWSDCFSYGADNELSLDKSRVTQLVGKNGHGKSSIPLIIQELLYNKNSKSIKKSDIPNRHVDSNTYSAALDFELNGSEYFFSIVRKGVATKTELLKDGVDIGSHTASATYKQVSDLLGMDFSTFGQLVYQSSNSSLEFLTATDTQRKKFLISLLNLGEYTAKEKIIKAELSELKVELAVVESSVKTIENWLTKYNLDSLEEQTKKEIPPEPQNLRDELAKVKNNLNNLSYDNKKIKDNLVNKKKAEDAGFTAGLLMDAKPPEEDIATLTENKGKASSIKSTALAQRLKMEKLGDKCPTCESTIDRSRVVTIINSQAQLEKAAADKLKELDVRITEARNAQLEYASKLRHEKEHKMYSELVDPSLPTELIDIYDLEDNFNKLTKQIKDAENAINLIRAANSKVDQHNEKIKLITQQTDDHLEELGVKAATMRALEVRVSHLDVLKRAFGTMGLVAFKIESMVKDLESLINQYLVDMSDGRFNIAFIVTESKLNVDLLDSGVPISISALSSGELARVNIATLLAIRKLMNSLNNNKLNLLFLDEVTTVLDDEGKERLVEVLSKETDINAFIVSHGWQHPLVDKVEVIKENDISRIEW